MKVEAEGKELIMRSDDGAVAIIPVKDSDRIRDLAELDTDESNAMISEYISGLPVESDYVKRGIFVAPEEKKKEVPMGAEDLSTLTTEEKELASSNAMLEEERLALKEKHGITETNSEEVMKGLVDGNPKDIMESLVLASAYEDDAEESMNKNVDTFNEANSFYKVVTEESGDNKTRHLQAQANHYELASDGNKNPLYLRHYNKYRNDKTPIVDKITKEEFDTEVKAWKDNDRKPTYVNIPENSELYNIDPDNIAE